MVAPPRPEIRADPVSEFISRNYTACVCVQHYSGCRERTRIERKKACLLQKLLMALEISRTTSTRSSSNDSTFYNHRGKHVCVFRELQGGREGWATIRTVGRL